MKLSARQKYEAKKISREKFDFIFRKSWQPVRLEKATIPAFLKGMQDVKIIAVYGSGSLDDKNPVADGNPDHGQVGGIDVYRVAETRDGVSINKDWYAIYQDPENPEQLLLIGPKRDAEHWINSIPSRLAFAEPASVEKVIKDKEQR